jgi:hypothetical protein
MTSGFPWMAVDAQWKHSRRLKVWKSAGEECGQHALFAHSAQHKGILHDSIRKEAGRTDALRDS